MYNNECRVYKCFTFITRIGTTTTWPLSFAFLFLFLRRKKKKKKRKKGVVPSTTYLIGSTTYLLINLLGFCTTWGGVRRGYIFNDLCFIIVE
jgi:hypothetical protein